MTTFSNMGRRDVEMLMVRGVLQWRCKCTVAVNEFYF